MFETYTGFHFNKIITLFQRNKFKLKLCLGSNLNYIYCSNLRSSAQYYGVGFT